MDFNILIKFKIFKIRPAHRCAWLLPVDSGSFIGKRFDFLE
jgi:hypothetical protein